MSEKTVLDVLYITVGPFIGAGLAFLSTRWHDARRQHQQDVAAGNLALNTIGAMYNEYLLWRLGAYSDMADRARASDSPLWVSMLPSVQSFGDLSIDFKALSFLFEHPNAVDSLSAVRLAEMTYQDMVAMNEFRNNAARAIFEVLSARKFASHAEAAAALGEHRVAAMITAVKSVASRARDNERIYVNAFASLKSALEVQLDNWWAPKPKFLREIEVLPHFRKENLPELPARIQQMLAEVDRERASVRAVSH